MWKINFTDLELNDKNSPSSLNYQQQEKSLIHSYFELYWMIYYERKPKQKSILAQKMQLLIVEFIWFIQIGSLLWIPHLDISDWKDNKKIWKLIGYIRLDNLCSEFGVISLCIYSSIVFVIANIIGIFVIVILIYYSFSIPKSMIKISKSMFYAFRNVLYVPISILFFICLKYNWFPENFIWEYEQNNQFSYFELSIPIQILIIFSIIGQYFINLMTTVCTAEIRHSMAHQIIGSKAFSIIDIYTVSYTAIMPILFVILGVDNTMLWQTILMVISAILMIETLKMAPYFNLFMNCLVSIKFFEISFLSFLFISAKIINASLIVLLSVFTLIPLFTILTIQLIKKIVKKLNFTDKIGNEKNIYMIEKNLRLYLCTNDIGNKNKILSFFGQTFNRIKNYENKLFAIWETNYCIFTLEDEALAKIKLCKAKYSDHSIEGDYQEFICRKIVSESNAEEGLRFLDFFKNINQIKNQDESLCIELINFWNEIVSPKPNIQKLNKALDFISQSATSIEEHYSSLHEKFPKSKEALNCYLTFIKQILCDYNKSIQLNYKFQTLEEFASQPSQTSLGLSFFDENNGIMLISCEHESFGVILYANQKASEILKYPANQIIENKISVFIPPPYDSYLSSQGPDFISSILDVEIKIPNHIFLLLPNRFIIDCIGKVILSSISDHLIFLFVFQEIILPQEFAVIDSEWEICCQSENFAKFSQKLSEDLTGINIKEIFPSLKHIDLQPFTPYPLADIDVETYLIPCYMEFYDTRINYILLINNQNEIEAWKNNQRHLSIEKNHEPFPLHNILLDLPQHKYEVFENSQKIELSQNSESYSWYLTFDKITNLSSRSIKIFHFVFVLAMLIVMLTNSFVLIYTSAAIVEQSDIDLLILLGKIGKSVQALAHFSRGMNVLNGFYGVQELVDFSFKHFLINLNTLEEVHYNVTWDLTNWKICEGTDVFMDESVFLWSVDDKFFLKRTNLIDAISEFILQGHIFIEKWNNSEDQTKQVQFFNINGLDHLLHYCNRTLYSSTDCVMQKSEDLGLKMNYLLSAGFIVLVICLIITMFFAQHVVSSENNLWSQIKRHTCEQHENLKNTCIDRLVTIHGKNDIWFYDIKTTKSFTKFINYWKYIWRNFAYFALALAFFLINVLFLYDGCVSYLQLRPSILREIINSQVLYKSLIVWTSEESIDDAPVSLSNMMSSSYPFPEAITLVSHVISSLWYSEKEIRSHKYSSLLSEKFRQAFYAKTENVAEIADFGIYAAGGVLPFEAYYLDVNGRDDLVLWFDLVCEINALDSQYDLLVNLADEDSKTAISEQLNWITIALAFFIVLSLILYFAIYLPFLIEEQRRLKKMKAIAKLIPRNHFN